MCQALSDVIGDGSLPPTQCWLTLLESQCRTGQELARAWQQLQLEDTQSCDYLRQEQTGVLATDAAGAGHGRRDGSTRQTLVTRREELRGAVLTQCLERKPDQRCRQVVAWRNRDKLATAWMHCLPGPEGMSNPAFSEALESCR